MISDHTAKYRKEHYLNLKKMINKAEEYYKLNPGKLKQLNKDNLEKAKRQYYEEYYKYNRKRISGQAKQYRKKNKEILRGKNKEWRKNNPEKVLKSQGRYRHNNYKKIRKQQNQYQKDRLKIDLKFNLSNKMSNAIGRSLKRTKSIKSNKNGRHWEIIVNYTKADLVKRLNKTMPAGYTWKDFLSGELHIDHIIPISAFNFTRPEHTDFKRCWALGNLRLLLAKENLSKHNKLDRPFQPALKI